jgi:hypothetical protein
LKVTCQQRPVEAIGSVAEAAASTLAFPPEAEGTKPSLGRKSATDDAAVDGRSEKMKLAVEPGPVP